MKYFLMKLKIIITNGINRTKLKIKNETIILLIDTIIPTQ